jgi:[protein-PII] uridylyltransferase
VLTGEAQVSALLEKRRAAGRAAAGAPGPVKIILDNQLSDDYTVLEVKCPDRLGLLYLVTKTLAAHGLDIATARIATEIDQAVDTFYVHDGQGRKVEDPDALGRVREALEHALVQPI